MLDKKNRNRELSGCWLFTTLEPCSPGARNAPKISCAERIVNARISDVWFGIEDKNPKVDHDGIDHLVDNNVKVHQFAPDFHKEIEEINKKFMKWANMKYDEDKAKKLKPQDHLNERATETDLDSLSDIALQKFLTESNRIYKTKSEELLRELKEMDFLEYDEKSKTYLPTGNAILLFGENPRNKFPQAAIKAKVNYGDGKTGVETFDYALVLIPDKVEEWLRKVLPASIDRSKFKAQQVPSFPVEVIREAVINAVAHRDYALDGAKVQIEVYPDRIIVKSPGEPLHPITIEALKKFTANSYSRNKKLTFIFNEMDYMEESAVGMDTFRSLPEMYKLPLPIFEYDGINTVVTFPRTIDAIRKVIQIESINELSKDELSAFEILRSNISLTKTEFAAHTGLPNRTAERLLKKLTDLNLIKRRGSGPSTYYIINE